MNKKITFRNELRQFPQRFRVYDFLRQKKAITLMELILASVLLGGVLLTVNGIDAYSRDKIVTADRRTRTQNEATFILDHMAKNISQAIGSSSAPGIEISGGSNIKVRWDRNINAIPDDDVGTDWIAYLYDPATHQLNYDPTYPPLGGGWPAGGETISNKVEAFQCIYTPGTNFVYVEVIACFRPNWATYSCGTPENPTISMHTRIGMPGISTN
jgi:hypothetical protein